MEPSATTVTGPVGERLQAGTEDAPVLDRLAPLRRLHDSGAGYKYPYLLTYGLGPSKIQASVLALVLEVEALALRFWP